MGEKRRAWNSTLPAPSEPIKRSGPIRAKGKPRFKVSGKPDRPYRAWIREQPCVLSGKPGHRCRGETEACHVVTKGAGGKDRGNLFAACSRAHGAQHHQGMQTFQQDWGVNLTAVARELEARYVLRDFSGSRTPNE